MASLEMARAYMESEGKERLNRNIDCIYELIESLESIDKVNIFTEIGTTKLSTTGYNQSIIGYKRTNR